MTRIQTLIIVAAASAAACTGRKNVQCEQDSNCDLSGGGVCTTVAETNNRWCAYPDPQCESGYRFSDFDVGDGVSNQCVPDGGTTVSKYTLTVQVGGSGRGVISSTPEGVACGEGACTMTFEPGTQVMLAAAASSGDFLGWSDECTGRGPCAVTMDRDRTVTALFGMFGEALWSQQIGDAEADAAGPIATTSDGNLIVAGQFRGTFTIGSQTLKSAGQGDIFVAKLSAATGDVLWIKSFGGTGNDNVTSIALDASDNVYMAGAFTGSVDFGGGTLTATNVDGFALKLDSSGSYVWAKGPLGGPNADGATGIAVRGTTVALVGSYSRSITVNGVTLMNSGTQQGYLVEWGTDGSDGLVKAFPGSYNTQPVGVALDSSNNIIVVGNFNQTANFGGGDVTSDNNSLDVFLVKYSATGAYLFQKILGGSSSDQAGGMSIDANDNIILVGKFTGNVSFGGPSPINANSNNVVVAKYSLAGAYLWAQPFGGTTAQAVATGAAANAAGDVVIAGYFCGNMQMGAKLLSSVGTCPTDNDIFVARLASTDGSPVTAARAGGSDSDAAYGVTQAPDGRHFVAGTFKGFAEFGGEARMSVGGSSDAVILGLAPL